MTESSGLELRLLSKDEAHAVRAMTFPVYHHLLDLLPAPRHPEQGDKRVVQPVAVVAWREGEPVGMALAESPLVPGEFPEMLSLYVIPEARGEGIATALVERLESVLRGRGFQRLTAVYMTGKPSIDALERVLFKCGWDAPVARTVTLRYTTDEAPHTPWYGRVKLPEPDFQVFPWTEVTAEERTELQRTNWERQWITAGLEPWGHDRYGFEPISSLGLRYRGRVVGWVINHLLADDSVRFTCAFMRPDLARRGRLFALFTASLERLRAAGGRTCMFVTPVVHRAMVEFVRERCAPWATFFGETRGACRNFAPVASALAGSVGTGGNGRKSESS